MPRGPLPKPDRRRRNAEVIQSSTLPAEGRTGTAPRCPYPLGAHGKKWWRWAWRSPQATKWDDGALYALARRAALEDDLDTLEQASRFDLGDFLDLEESDRDAARRLEVLIRRLKSLAGGRVSVMREMRELDNRFGLNPKAMGDLRWTIGEAQQPEQPAGVAALADYRKSLGG